MSFQNNVDFRCSVEEPSACFVCTDNNIGEKTESLNGFMIFPLVHRNVTGLRFPVSLCDSWTSHLKTVYSQGAQPGFADPRGFFFRAGAETIHLLLLHRVRGPDWKGLWLLWRMARQGTWSTWEATVVELDALNIWGTRGMKDTCCMNRREEKAGQEGLSWALGVTQVTDRSSWCVFLECYKS